MCDCQRGRPFVLYLEKSSVRFWKCTLSAVQRNAYKKTRNIVGQQATTTESDEGSELNTEHHAPQNTRQRDRQTDGWNNVGNRRCWAEGGEEKGTKE